MKVFPSAFPGRAFLVFILFLIAVAVGAPPARAIEIVSVTSPKGVTAWLIQDKSVPLVSLRFAFRGGAALDPEGKSGLAQMATALLTEGAGDLDSAEFQKKLSAEAISLGFSAGFDSVGGNLRALRDKRGMAFDLLALTLTAPRFDPEPVARVRGQMLAAIQRESERPRNVAERTWRKTVFDGHPYARDTDGNKESVTGITTDDLRIWVKRHFARDNLIVGVVGDITPEELGPLLDRAFGGLPARTQLPEVADAALHNVGEVVVVRRDIPQTVVTFGQKGLPIEDPDFYAASVMTYILGGGGLTSRLADEIREKRGLAYSVYASLVTYDHAPLLMGWVATQNARVARTLDLIRAEWRRMATEPVAEAELDDAKSYLINAYYTRLTSTSRIADILVGLQLDRRPIDYLDRRKALISAVTVKDIARVAKRLLKADALTVVMVGDPEGVTATP